MLYHEEKTSVELDGRMISAVMGIEKDIGGALEVALRGDSPLTGEDGEPIWFPETEEGDEDFNRAVSALAIQYELDHLDLVKSLGLRPEEWGPDKLSTMDVRQLCGTAHITAAKFAAKNGVSYTGEGYRKNYVWTLGDVRRFRAREKPGRRWGEKRL
jgi:hypothetical protein